MRVPHSRGEYRFDAPEVIDDTHEPITSFKDFDYKNYGVENERGSRGGKVKKAESALKKLGKKIYRISTSEEVRWAAGLLLTVYVLSGKNKTDRDSEQVLRDIKDGRLDHSTLETARDIVVDIYQSLTGKKKEKISNTGRRRKRPSRF